MSDEAVTDDTELAADTARRAGELLIELQQSGEYAGEDLGREGDRRANTLIIDALQTARPGDAILSEEMADSPARFVRKRVWIVDPLDGTWSYREGRKNWAVHIALTKNGRPVLGAVAIPHLGEVWRSDQEFALHPPREKPRIVVSRNRMPPETEALAEALGGTIHFMGSAGAKAMAVVRGEADIYYHTGGQHEWDSAAPVAVAVAAGLHCSCTTGAKLEYNRRKTWMPNLLICHPDWARRTLDAIAAL